MNLQKSIGWFNLMQCCLQKFPNEKAQLCSNNVDSYCFLEKLDSQIIWSMSKYNHSAVIREYLAKAFLPQARTMLDEEKQDKCRILKNLNELWLPLPPVEQPMDTWKKPAAVTTLDGRELSGKKSRNLQSWETVRRRDYKFIGWSIQLRNRLQRRMSITSIAKLWEIIAQRRLCRGLSFRYNIASFLGSGESCQKIWLQRSWLTKNSPSLEKFWDFCCKWSEPKSWMPFSTRVWRAMSPTVNSETITFLWEQKLEAKFSKLCKKCSFSIDRWDGSLLSLLLWAPIIPYANFTFKDG